MIPAKRSRIYKAVIPAAGHGTRLQPLTYIAPKEMLPLGRKPTVEHIVEELHGIGISDIIFVVSLQKAGIQQYFGESACNGEVRIKYVVQEEQKGLAHAILQAEDEVAGEHFVVALGDSVILSRRPVAPIARLVEAYKSNPALASIIVERVPAEDAYRNGMVKPIGDTGRDSFEIEGLIEKPKPGESPSDFAIGGRYVFDPEIFDWIRKTPPGACNELQITDSVRLGMLAGNRVWCAPLQSGENRYDIGNIKTYCEAFAAVCMFDNDVAPLVSDVVQDGKAYNTRKDG